MRIVYVGNQRHSWCTEVHLAATMRDLGHEVIFAQEDEWSVDQIRNEAFQSDLLFYTRTWGHREPEKFLQMLADLKRAGIASASYHLDLYVGLQREDSIVGDPFWSTEYVFTPDGSQEAADFFAARGINHHYIKPGVFKGECVPGTFRPEFDNDIVFVGSHGAYHTEWPYRDQLVGWLYSTYGEPQFKRYGAGATVVRGEPLNDLYASAKVVVGDSLCLNFTRDHYWSDRVYETVGRGGFLIHPFIEGLEEEFTAGKHMEFYEFNDWDGLKGLVDFYVAHPELAREIANAGQAHVRETATYNNRLSQAFEIMGLA